MDMTVSGTVPRGNATDSTYGRYQTEMTLSLHAAAAEGPLFRTDATDLYEVYLTAFPEGAERQHHTCRACERFIKQYGTVVTVDAQGHMVSAFWNERAAPEDLFSAIAALNRRVQRSEIVSPFYSSDDLWGTPVTGDWRHFAAQPPSQIMFRKRGILTASQVMAEKKEDYGQVCRALAEYKVETLNQALGLLETDALYRSEKVKGPVSWLHDLAIQTSGINKERRQNLIWRAIATAPAGFAHPRSSMAGTLLDDIAEGLPMAEVAKRFAAKMHPLQYQRPTAAPAAGTIAQAEKIFEEMGLAPALRRRYATLEDIRALWRPASTLPVTKSGGVFGHLKNEPLSSPIEGPLLTMTWSKFRSTALADAESIEIYVPYGNANFATLVTAVDPEAPPLLQWDAFDQRNPVSWYVYYSGSPASQYGLTRDKYYPVSAVTLQPSMWGEFPLGSQGKGVIFLIEGAKDSINNSLCLFPETLRSELQGIRSVIEAHSRKSKLEGKEAAAATGLRGQDGIRNWDIKLRVKSKGRIANYLLDRWD